MRFFTFLFPIKHSFPHTAFCLSLSLSNLHLTRMCVCVLNVSFISTAYFAHLKISYNRPALSAHSTQLAWLYFLNTSTNPLSFACFVVYVCVCDLQLCFECVCVFFLSATCSCSLHFWGVFLFACYLLVKSYN